MQIQDLVDKELILVQLEASSKKRSLELISAALAERVEELERATVFEALVERERLGSTGMGNGFAIPHCRIESDSEKIYTAVVTLKKPIDFDSSDGTEVDLLFVMIVLGDANQSHLDALAMVAQLYGDSKFCKNIRKAESPKQVYKLFKAAPP